MIVFSPSHALILLPPPYRLPSCGSLNVFAYTRLCMYVCNVPLQWANHAWSDDGTIAGDNNTFTVVEGNCGAGTVPPSPPPPRRHRPLITLLPSSRLLCPHLISRHGGLEENNLHVYISVRNKKYFTYIVLWEVNRTVATLSRSCRCRRPRSRCSSSHPRAHPRRPPTV